MTGGGYGASSGGGLVMMGYEWRANDSGVWVKG